MGYDLNIYKVKKDKIDNLLKNLNCSLDDAYNSSFITFYEEEYEYHKDVIFLEEKDCIWSDFDILRRCFRELNLKVENSLVTIILKEEFKEILNWFENYLKTSLFNDLEFLEGYEISKYFDLYKNLLKIEKDFTKEDELIVVQDW